jgi:hypothetical protein
MTIEEKKMTLSRVGAEDSSAVTKFREQYVISTSAGTQSQPVITAYASDGIAIPQAHSPR